MQHNSIDMDYIFQTCPHLQSLQLESPSTLYLQGSGVGTSGDDNTGSYIPPLGLSASRTPASLIAASLLQATPHMKLLQLHNLRRHDSGEGYSWNHLYKQSLQEHPNVVTTLSLVTESVNQPNMALALHQYLCESPHLFHFKASQSLYLIERMNLFGCWMALPRYGEDAYRQAGIWMCRQFQALHIEVHNLGSSRSSTIAYP
ncbi:hypothetical protein EC957_007965 [Mortierella hygrophila]|uniref:Uncharacterized protein n=1 Tax=Mortierella hygrophila TaxID=979708 RepID=A0A9P6JY45_9FUNG|nr:hypothetical protein EC957_007965 [Mortierella hygrophila]